MRDETAKDNRQTAVLITHHLAGNNELVFLLLNGFEILNFSFCDFGFGRMDVNDILWKSDVKSRRPAGSVDQTLLESASENERK